MDKRDFIRLAVADSNAQDGGAVLNTAAEHHAVADSTAINFTTEQTAGLPYPLTQATEDAILAQPAGAAARNLITSQGLKKRRQAARPRWRQN